MSSNVIAFPKRDELPEGLRRALNPVWVPEYAFHVIDGIGVPYWTGKETLCRLNPDKDPQAEQFGLILWGGQRCSQRFAPIRSPRRARIGL